MPTLNVRSAAGTTDTFGLSREADLRTVLGTFIDAALYGSEVRLLQSWFTPGGWADWCDHGKFVGHDPERTGGVTATYGDGEHSFLLLNSDDHVLMSISTDV